MIYPEYWVLRFNSRIKVLSADECWEWQRAIDKNGYGRIGLGRKLVLYAHRVAKELSLNEKIDGSIHVCHACDNPKCCNPSHLFLGNQSINSKDMIAKGRNVPPPAQIGIANVNAKLTPEIVMEIRQKHQNGIKKTAISREYGITYQTVWRVLSGKSWKHV